MALASYEEARSPTALSLSPLFHYQYGSISKAVSDLARNSFERTKVQKVFQALCYAHYSPPDGSAERLVFQTDTTPMGKAHSPTLPDRTYIAVPNNVIRGNKPLDIGYEVSFINLSEPLTRWSLPLSVERVGPDQTASEKALEQLGQLLAHPELGLSDRLCINTLDSKYGNLVNLVRFRTGMKVWRPAQDKPSGQGAPKVFDEKFYLISESRTKTYKKHPKTGLAYQVYQRSVFEKQEDEYLKLDTRMATGRKVFIEIWRWNELLIRSKNGNNMKNKPFDLLAIKVRDAQSGKPVFDRDMFVAINGRRKDEVTSRQGHQIYRRRYDIEPALRFAKQRLLLDKLQTPDVEHFDNWLLVHQMTVWLLYTASDEADFRPRKWRKYLVQNKELDKQHRLSIAQTRHAAQNLFLTFNPEPFKPLKSKKGRPRQKGETQIQRTRYKVVKKTSGKTNLTAKRQVIKLKTEKIE